MIAAASDWADRFAITETFSGRCVIIAKFYDEDDARAFLRSVRRRMPHYTYALVTSDEHATQGR